MVPPGVHKLNKQAVDFGYVVNVKLNSGAHAESTNMFKTRLDKFWMNQEIIYDYHAEIQGTGSRSEIY